MKTIDPALQRTHLNNSRLLVLPECHYPNLISRFMKLMVNRLSGVIRELFEEMDDPRRKQSKAYPLPGLLTIVLMATLCRVTRGQRDLAAFAKTMTQGQLRRLGFRRSRRTREVRTPGAITFFRALRIADERQIEEALLRWQEKILGPALRIQRSRWMRRNSSFQCCGLVSAFGVESGRWLGSECTDSKSNEIPAAKKRVDWIELSRKTLLADALHTQTETAGTILFEKGGDYWFTVRGNRKDLLHTSESLLVERSFFPRSVENGKRAPKKTERNRGRMEQRDLVCEPTTPPAMCFPGSAQVGRLTRQVKNKDGSSSTQTVHVLSSHPPDKLSPEDFRRMNCDYSCGNCANATPQE